MRILVDANHPAHVHFFKHFIWSMQQRGHEVSITASRKDVVFDLLKHYNFAYIDLGSYGHSLLSKLVQFSLMSIKMWRAARELRPDIILGIASIRGAHVGRLLRGCQSVIFDDTEHASEQIRLYLPFADRVFTPSCFRKELGHKHQRYQGYHELAYLHPSRFTPNPAVLDDAGIDSDNPYFLVRFVSWESTHDIGYHGISDAGKRKLIQRLAEHGRVIITAESELPGEYEQYRLPVEPQLLHDLLAFAHLYVGEGATMASEAAVLGTPSIYVNPLGAGTIDQQQALGLLHHVPDEDEAIELAVQLAADADAPARHSRRRATMLQEQSDVTQWMVEMVESLATQRRAA